MLHCSGGRNRNAGGLRSASPAFQAEEVMCSACPQVAASPYRRLWKFRLSAGLRRCKRLSILITSRRHCEPLAAKQSRKLQFTIYDLRFTNRSRHCEGVHEVIQTNSQLSILNFQFSIKICAALNLIFRLYFQSYSTSSSSP